jgi:predicted lipase
MDTRQYTRISTIELHTEILNSIIASQLSYLNPDILFDKWDRYNNTAPVNPTDTSYYSIKENIINTFLFNTKKPIYYDANMNDSKTLDAQMVIFIKDDICYIAFRGTSSLTDVIYDLEGFQTSIIEDKTVKVHKGFYIQFLALKDWIDEILKTLKYDKIIFTGHSAGGAIATIAASVYSLNKQLKEITCISFGSPRVGNLHFKSFFTNNVKNHYRITNSHDEVPLLPFLPGYYHVSDAYHIQNDTLFRQTGDLHLIYRIFNFLYDLRKPIYYHSYDLYIQNILKLINSTSA